MANVAPNLEERQEFWKPAVAPRPEVVQAEQARATVCRNCGGELVVGSRFCSHCGTDSQALVVDKQQLLAPVWLSLAAWRRVSGRTIACVAALVLGCACIIAAVLTSYIYPATTLVDWQAVQMWRIEWLLAAIAILLAGILVKKN
jgi:hypothetical protein